MDIFLVVISCIIAGIVGWTVYGRGLNEGRHREQMAVISIIANMTLEERSGTVGQYENILLKKLREEWK